MFTQYGWPNAISLTYFEKVLMDKGQGKDWDYESVYTSPGKSKEHIVRALVYSDMPMPTKRDPGRDITMDEMKELGTVDKLYEIREPRDWSTAGLGGPRKRVARGDEAIGSEAGKTGGVTK